MTQRKAAIATGPERFANCPWAVFQIDVQA